MKATELLALYSQIPGLPLMQLYSLSITSERFDAADKAYAQLANFQSVQGWAGFQSANRIFADGIIPVMDGETGQLLAAEAVHASGDSLHIRFDGAGKWIVTRYATVEGNDYLADSVEHIARADTNLGKLRYRRFWHIGQEHGYEPFAACFIGFEKEGGGVTCQYKISDTETALMANRRVVAKAPTITNRTERSTR